MYQGNKKHNLAKIVRDLKNFERERLPEWVIAHQKEVAVIAYRMGEILKLNDQQLAALAIAARFHDIGKTKIDKKIIDGDSDLGVIEILEILDHVEFSYSVLVEQGMQWKPVLDTVLSHHENFNGTGYPNKFKGNEIPLTGQILRIVDSFSAMHGARPYPNAKGKDIEISMQEIENKKGIFYNPEIVDLFLGMVKQSISYQVETQNFENPVININEILQHCGIKSGKFFTVIRALTNKLDGLNPFEAAT